MGNTVKSYFRGSGVVATSVIEVAPPASVPRQDPVGLRASSTSNRVILLNQMYCHACRQRVVSISDTPTTCTCGNVSVWGGSAQLGGACKEPTRAEECSMVVFQPAIPVPAPVPV